MRQNRITANRTDGILVAEASLNAVQNLIAGNGAIGVSVRNDSSATLTGSYIRNGGDGVFIGQSSCTTRLERTRCRATDQNGVLVGEGADDSFGGCERTVRDYRAMQNDVGGIADRGYTGPLLITGNRADRNGDDGIEVGTTTNFLGELEWTPGDRIAFQGEREIWLVKGDGTGLQRFTTGAWPAWSPDGGSLAFSDGGLDLLNAGGSNRRKSNDHEGDQYAWSPVGTRIAFWGGCENGTSDLCVKRVDGNGFTQRTARRWQRSGMPTWSPDGSRLAMTVLQFPVRARTRTFT